MGPHRGARTQRTWVQGKALELNAPRVFEEVLELNAPWIGGQRAIGATA